MSLLLINEAARLSPAPLRPLRLACLGKGAALGDVRARLGGAAKFVNANPAGRRAIACDVVALVGVEARAVTPAMVSAVLARAKAASLCVLDTYAQPGGGSWLAAVAAVAEAGAEFGFTVTSMRAFGSSASAPEGARVYLERGDGANGDCLIRALALDAFGLTERAMSVLSESQDPLCSHLMHTAFSRAARLDGWGATAPVADALEHSKAPRGWSRERNRILVSIHIQSNSPENVRQFFNRVANSCDDPSRVEVIVKIDDDHVQLNELLPREVERQPFQLKYVSTPLIGGFFELWRSMNDMLAITDPSAYFLLNLNDEMLFLDRGWDTRLARYVGLFADDLFRLRTSIYRNRNYHDHWECGFAPETSAVTTKKWIDTGGNWNPCLGPDTFQQCVAFHFNRLRDPGQREVPIEDIRFGGEGAYVGLSGDALRRRVRGATKAWFRLMSDEIQTEAAKRAAKIHAAIAAHGFGLGPEAVVVDEQRREVVVRDGADVTDRIGYGAPPLRYSALNVRRSARFSKYGGGGADSGHGLVRSVASFLALRYDWADRMRTLAKTAIEPTQKLDPISRALRFLMRIPYYAVHAPDYWQLFYLRHVRHWLNLADLVRRRGLQKARNLLWWVVIGVPRRLRDHIDLVLRRGAGASKGALGVVFYGRLRVLSAAFRAPKWIVGHSALAFHRSRAFVTGHAGLLARRTYVALKVLAWRTCIDGPRRIAAHIDLAARRSWSALAGWSALIFRRGFGIFKVSAWWVLIGAPRHIGGWISGAAVQTRNGATPALVEPHARPRAVQDSKAPTRIRRRDRRLRRARNAQSRP